MFIFLIIFVERYVYFVFVWIKKQIAKKEKEMIKLIKIIILDSIIIVWSIVALFRCKRFGKIISGCCIGNLSSAHFLASISVKEIKYKIQQRINKEYLCFEVCLIGVALKILKIKNINIQIVNASKTVLKINNNEENENDFKIIMLSWILSSIP